MIFLGMKRYEPFLNNIVAKMKKWTTYIKNNPIFMQNIAFLGKKALL